MVLNAETSVTPSSPHLPPEIIDLIVGFAVQGLDPRSLSSVALVSHRLRLLANDQRFSSISFVYNDTERYYKNEKIRIRKLAQLMQNVGAIPTMRGTHTFITSLTLKVRARSDFLTFTKLGYLSIILDNLFRDSAVIHAPVRMLSLDIAPYQPFRDWGNDGNSLLESLLSLIRTSHLNELCVLKGSGIPLDLIHGSNIERLRLGTMVQFDDIVDLKPVSSPVGLKSLWIENVWEDSDLENYIKLICGTLDPPPTMFSDLAKLTVYNGSNVFISRILGLTKCLETLTIGGSSIEHTFIVDRLVTERSIPYHSLPFLKRLHIKCHYVLLQKITEEAVPIKMLGRFEIPPSLESLTLSITSYIHDNGIWQHPDLDAGHLFSGRRENVWDKHLASLPLRSQAMVEVEIRLTRLIDSPPQPNTPPWEDQFKTVFMSPFPLCTATYPNFRVLFYHYTKGGV